MVRVLRGEIWWASLPEPRGSESGSRRPVLVVQANAFNRSRIHTVIVVVLTSNLRLGRAPGNLLLSADSTGLPRDSVANVSQVFTVDRRFLTERVGRISSHWMQQVDRGLVRVLGLL